MYKHGTQISNFGSSYHLIRYQIFCLCADISENNIHLEHFGQMKGWSVKDDWAGAFFVFVFDVISALTLFKVPNNLSVLRSPHQIWCAPRPL
jgi:hypothetical protein